MGTPFFDRRWVYTRTPRSGHERMCRWFVPHDGRRAVYPIGDRASTRGRRRATPMLSRTRYGSGSSAGSGNARPSRRYGRSAVTCSYVAHIRRNPPEIENVYKYGNECIPITIHHQYSHGWVRLTWCRLAAARRATEYRYQNAGAYARRRRSATSHHHGPP
jgi:hypothetical protein